MSRGLDNYSVRERAIRRTLSILGPLCFVWLRNVHRLDQCIVSGASFNVGVVGSIIDGMRKSEIACDAMEIFYVLCTDYVSERSLSCSNHSVCLIQDSRTMADCLHAIKDRLGADTMTFRTFLPNLIVMTAWN